MVSFEVISTQPIQGQQTGTSGLRKKTKVFMSENYLQNWIQSLFNALGEEKVRGSTLVLGGDGRFFNKEAIQIILSIGCANGVAKFVVGQNGILSTPAVSAIIRGRNARGGIIMTASHNPGGLDEDWGIKYNSENGGPAPEALTNIVFEETQKIQNYKIAKLPTIDLAQKGTHNFDNFEVEIVDSVDEYLDMLKRVFDFDRLRKFIQRKDFNMLYDSMNGVTGAYTTRIFCDELGAPKESLMNFVPLPDFGGHHPDPNLTYAAELVAKMNSNDAPVLGAASDGDGDRNMILGKQFFVTPSDSVAIIAQHAQKCIPYFKDGLKGLARSMPTSTALDRVAQKLGVGFYEVPTGWKYFGNLMDAGKLSICGEESFGTGSDHIREKDGVWAVLAWLSILAYFNESSSEGHMVSIAEIVQQHWKEFGRSFYTRYDYENCASQDAANMINELSEMAKNNSAVGQKLSHGGSDYTVKEVNEFEYVDPIDGSVASKQGIRMLFEDGSRVVFRLSGTGSSGATVRVYMEQYEGPLQGGEDANKFNHDSAQKVKNLAHVALALAKLQEHTKRTEPTVIT